MSENITPDQPAEGTNQSPSEALLDSLVEAMLPDVQNMAVDRMIGVFQQITDLNEHNVGALHRAIDGVSGRTDMPVGVADVLHQSLDVVATAADTLRGFGSAYAEANPEEMEQIKAEVEAAEAEQSAEDDALGAFLDAVFSGGPA